jgi:energy-coupling factor transport system ATP-binding protein
LGENAAGKTTLLKIIAGLLKPGRGKVKVFNKDIRNTSVEELAGSVGYLSQNPNDYLSLPSVRKELSFTLKNLGLSDNGRVEETLKKLQLTRYADVDPRDLSTGERQRVALASVLVAKPKLLLLDEPTRGLDYHLKRELGNILLQLQAEGTAVLLVTHDVEFAAEFARDVILMAEGTIIDTGSKYDVLTRSTFYSPQVNKLFYNIKDDVVILDEAEAVLNQLVKQKARKWVMKV